MIRLGRGGSPVAIRRVASPMMRPPGAPRRSALRRVGALLLAWLIAPGPAALAQTTLSEAPAAPPPTKELLLFMEVPTVVSGTGRQQPLTEAPSAISVVTAD